MKAKKILISQPKPADIDNSPYKKLIAKYHADITFFKFFDIVGVTATEFRRSRIHLQEHTAVIFNSKNSVDHFFRLAKELRTVIPESMKYFCTTEAIALYLQNYIQYRKRKIFFGEQSFADLIEIMERHREEQFIFPCSDEKQTDSIRQLDRAKFKYTKAVMYTLVPRDLKQFKLSDYDIIALFSPIGVRSLVQNFPDIKDEKLTIAAFGTSTHAALAAAGIKLTIGAPTKSAPSMAMAIENYLLGKEQDEVINPKQAAQKKAAVTAKAATGSKKPKSVIADKTKYRQLQEERKAKAAARRAERAAAKKASTQDVLPAQD
ncbi:MAG: uroporphyrinogen-III synthase [bacterium P3]|nr:MAG: uroporphyrinogen-III synthase [bacterium P3]KWW41496.1 MAG: uroporphyrinogen-III synthase [bacterium F083]